MTKKDYLTQFIETLETIRSRLISLKSSEVQETIMYLQLAINSLKTYKINNEQFVPKQPPTSINSNRTQYLRKQNSSINSQISGTNFHKTGHIRVDAQYRDRHFAKGHWRKK